MAALLLAACGSSDGAVRTETIDVPAPAGESADVALRVGASESFRLQAGATSLIQGTVQYNRAALKPAVHISGTSITIAQGDDSAISLPTAQLRNRWDLKLSDAIPMHLRVDAGAYQGSYDLGGLRLHALDVRQGAADTSFDFSSPNPEPMSYIAIESGAAKLQLANLANANAAEMRFNLEAGSNTLDFGGTLPRTARVAITVGSSALTINVPAGTPMRVSINGTLADVNANGFSVVDDQYVNQAWDESVPHVDVSIDGDVNSITLRTT